MLKKSLKTQLMILAFVGAFLVSHQAQAAAVEIPMAEVAPAGSNRFDWLYPPYDFDTPGNMQYLYISDQNAQTKNACWGGAGPGTYQDFFNSPPSGSSLELDSGTFSTCWTAGAGEYSILIFAADNTTLLAYTRFQYDGASTWTVLSPARTRWIGPYTPANGSYSSTTPTTFSATYYNAGTEGFDLATFSIKDVTDPSNHPLTFPVNTALGSQTITNHVQLTNSHAYLWRPVIYSSTSSSSPIYGDWYSFQSTSTPNATFDPNFISGTVGTSTLLSSTNLLSFLNVPSLLQTKIPFAYIFQIADGFATGLNASSTAIPSGVMSYKLPGVATSSEDMFSTSTISRFLSPTMIATLRGLQLAILYILVGYALYRIAKSKHLL